MIPSDRWQQYMVYSVFIMGGIYITTVSSYQTFEDVISAVQEHAREVLGNPDELGKLILVSHMTLGSADADLLAEGDLVDLYLEG